MAAETASDEIEEGASRHSRAALRSSSARAQLRASLLRRPRKAAFRRLATAGILVLAAAIVSVGFSIWQMRADDLDSHVETARKIAIILSGQVEKSIQAVDITLLDIQERVSQQAVRDVESLRVYAPMRWSAATLQERLTRLPQASSIAIADATGAIITSTNRDFRNVNIADREYFRELRDSESNQLVISTPLHNRVSGVMNLAIGRRLVGARGQFVGIVIAPVSVDYFRRISSPIETVKDMTILLAKRDGTVLIRHPDAVDRGGTKMPEDSPWHGIVKRGNGVYRSPGYFDGVARWVVVSTLGEYPLVLNTSISERAALARWQKRAVAIMVGAGLLVTCAAFLLWACLFQLRRLKRSKARLRENSRALALSNVRFDSALNNISHGLCMFDPEHRVLVSNARFAELYSLSLEEVARGTPLSVIEYACHERGTFAPVWARDALAGRARPIDELQHLQDGRTILVRGQSMVDGGWMTTHEDVTERYRNEQQIAYMARHDLLTELYNRAAFAEKIKDAGARLRRWGEAFSIILLDLDGFKKVNDSLGHPAGDALLRDAAKRLAQSIRETDVLARFGGDEFAIIQTGSADQREDAVAFANRIVEMFAQSFRVEGQDVVLSASVGIALAPEHGIGASELIKNADFALYRAKANGRNGYVVFDPDLMAGMDARQKLERELEQAIANDELVLYYQPQIDVRTGCISGAEALLRWRHPERGIVGPNEFIPIAEETGLIEPIGEWVLNAACREAASWPKDVTVAVNLSPAQFRRVNMFDAVSAALANSGLAPHRLELEITENVLLESETRNLATVKQLRELGVSVALDDFGKGYSSLSYLTIFPFSKIKIDKYFSMNLKRDDCAAIVASVITLARGLGMSTTAEGVETLRQFELLRAAGVDYCQGFLFGAAVPSADIAFGRPPEISRANEPEDAAEAA